MEQHGKLKHFKANIASILLRLHSCSKRMMSQKATFLMQHLKLIICRKEVKGRPIEKADWKKHCYNFRCCRM